MWSPLYMELIWLSKLSLLSSAESVGSFKWLWSVLGRRTVTTEETHQKVNPHTPIIYDSEKRLWRLFIRVYWKNNCLLINMSLNNWSMWSIYENKQIKLKNQVIWWTGSPQRFKCGEKKCNIYTNVKNKNNYISNIRFKLLMYWSTEIIIYHNYFTGIESRFFLYCLLFICHWSGLLLWHSCKRVYGKRFNTCYFCYHSQHVLAPWMYDSCVGYIWAEGAIQMHG